MSSTSAQGIPVSIDGAIGVSVEQQQQSSATGPLAELFIDDSIVDVSVHDNVITVNDNLTNTTITPGDSVTAGQEGRCQVHDGRRNSECKRYAPGPVHLPGTVRAINGNCPTPVLHRPCFLAS